MNKKSTKFGTEFASPRRIPIFTPNTIIILRKFLKITGRSLLAILLLVILLYGALHLSPVQNWLVKKVTSHLSKELNAEISIRHIDYAFFDKMSIEGLMVQDQQQDTLLYAGSAKVNITDWFFFKDNITLHYIGLDDAVIDLHRTDSVWNYQFLADYFTSPSKDTSQSGIRLDIQEIKLHNIQFKQIDQWKGQDMLVALQDLHLKADAIDFKNKKVAISSLDIAQPVFTMNDYTGTLQRLNINIGAKPVKKPVTQHKSSWVIDVKKIRITNGVFTSEKENLERAMFTDQFDGDHIRFSSINADLQNTHYQNDSISTSIVLATKERSGFEVKKLQANMKFTPEIMEFNNLDLVTNKSRLGNYYAMRYEDFNPDMGNFEHRVNLDARFIDSQLSSDDLAYFAPEVKTWKRLFALEGIAKGTVDNFSVKKMILKTGKSVLAGSVAMRGLPDINNTFIDLSANDLQTNIAEITTLIPSLSSITQPRLSRLGNIRYNGNYTGFINDFVAFGTINTDLGTVTGDINLKLPEGKSAIYSGKISTQSFRLGQFLEDNKLGAISFSGKVNGSGFSEQTLDAKFNGQVRSVVFNNYNYQNIILDGNFKKKLFKGNTSINDPNLQMNNLTGTIDFNGAEPVFDFDALLAKADFKKLGLSEDPFQLSGHFNFNFTGDNIDNFLGKATIYSASLLHDGKRLSFDSLLLESSIAENQKFLKLESNEVQASITGNFNIMDLPDAFTSFLSRYYPAYIKKPDHAVIDQDFSFQITTKEVDAYTQLIHPKLKGFNNSLIKGNLKLKANELNIMADIPEFSYDGKTFSNIRLLGKGSLDSLATIVDVDDIAISDSFHLPSTNLVFTSFNDTSNISIKTSASKTVSEAAINARLITMDDGVNIHFFPSSFIINDKKWQLEKDGEITFSKSQVSANAVSFIQGNQQIKIFTEPSGTLGTHDVLVQLSKVNIDDITLLANFTQPKLEGLISGQLRIEDPFRKPFIHYETDIEAFRTGKDSVGLLKANGTFDLSKGILNLKALSTNKDNQLDVDGVIYLNDSNSTSTRILVKSEKLDLSLLNSFLGDLFSDISGSANTTDLTYSIINNQPALTGTANINEGSLIVNFTRCKYLFKNESIVLRANEIDFGNIALKDTLGNIAQLSGKLYHNFFKSLEFDNIHLSTNKMLVLNTTKKDNSQFYGKVIGEADLTINGNEDNILMNITGEPSRSDSSHIYIVSGNSIESGEIDYIDFIQFGNQMEENYQGKSASNILVNMVINANPSCKVDVVLDEATGDIIKGEGEGRLEINVGNKAPLTIKGRYDLTRGEYTFNFQTFLKKYFTLNSGSIIWDGDPFNANIDIVAEYLATGVNFSTLGGNTGTGVGASTFNQESDLRVLAHLTETLLKPAIDFELQLPPGSGITDFLILKRLEQFKQDKNDLNKQITSLLLFNSFINTNQGFITAGGGYNVLANTIGGVVSNAISGFFNNLLQKYIKNLKFNIDVNSSLSNANLQSNVEQLQAAAKSNFIYTLLNGRLIISAGLNVDYNNPYANLNSNTNLLVTPDITVEWLLSPSGRVRVVGFNRTNYDLVGQRNRTGVSLSYRKDVEKLSDVFRDTRRKRTTAPPVVLPTQAN